MDQNLTGHFSSEGSAICSPYRNSSEPYYEFRATADLVMGIICIVLIPLVTTGNLLILLCLWRFKKLRTITNSLIGNLSVADSIVGLVTLPVYALFYLYYSNVGCNKYLCLFKFSSVACSMSASMINLVAIGFDRYVAILHPLKYKTWLTTKRIRIFVIVMWIYLIPVSGLPYVWNNYDSVQKCDYFRIFPKPYTIYASFVSIFICLIVSLFLYIRIYIVARKQQKQIRKDSVHFCDSTRKQMEKDMKSAKVMALILFLFYVFWVPFALAGPLKYLKIADNLAETLKNLTLTIAMSNSMINPFIYCYLRRDFRRAFVTCISDRYCCTPQKVPRKQSILLSQTIDSIDIKNDIKPRLSLASIDVLPKQVLSNGTLNNTQVNKSPNGES